MGNITLIESNDDTLRFERAFIGRDDNGEFIPLCLFSGILCELGTKESPLEIGFVSCEPVDINLLADWPLYVVLKKETAQGEAYTEQSNNCTGNARAVQAVRRFLELTASGQAHAGMEL
jgi:hypothetical protein